MSKNLAEKLGDIKPGTLFAGVDLAKDRNVTVVINQQGKRLTRFHFPNDKDGYEYHRRRLEKLREQQQAPAVMVGMEPTNYFWKLLAGDLEGHEQFPYRLVNAYTVKKHREGDQIDRAKDDPRDGFTIADLLRTGKFTQTQLLKGAYADLRQYAAMYDRVRKEIGRRKTLLRVAVGEVFPEISGVFKDLTRGTAKAMLHRHAVPADICALSEAEFIATVRTDYTGKRLEIGKLRQAYRLAIDSVGLVDTRAPQVAVGLHAAELALKQAHLATITTALLETFFSLPKATYMLSMGLGQVTTALIAAEIGDPHRYRRANQLVKLAGIQPTPNHSGRKARSATPMSRKGRPRLRTILYFASLRQIQQDPAFAQLYQQLQQRKRNPLTGKQALGVVMNKTLHVLWSLMRQQTFYDSNRLLAV
jgi:transposase